MNTPGTVEEYQEILDWVLTHWVRDCVACGEPFVLKRDSGRPIQTCSDDCHRRVFNDGNRLRASRWRARQKAA